MMYAHDDAECAHCGCRIPVANLSAGRCADVAWCSRVVAARADAAARAREDEAVVAAVSVVARKP